MAHYKGPCDRCGTHIEKRVRPNKERLCLDCGTAKMIDQQRRYADGTHPDLEKSIQAGHELARQIQARSGPLYERWVGGMAVAELPDTTKSG